MEVCGHAFAAFFNPGEITTGTHWIGGWTFPGTGISAMEKRKPLSLLEIVRWPFSP
jgi:hypothetical protein